AWISPRLRCSNAAPRQRYAKTSGARSRNEAADLRRAGGVLIRPHHGGAEFVRLGHQRRIGHDDPLSVEPHAVAALVGVPVDVFHLEAVGERAAQALAAGELVEPGLE